MLINTVTVMRFELRSLLLIRRQRHVRTTFSILAMEKTANYYEIYLVKLTCRHYTAMTDKYILTVSKDELNAAGQCNPHRDKKMNCGIRHTWHYESQLVFCKINMTQLIK